MSDATTQHTPADVREQAAADADEIWYHWIEGQEDLAIAALRKASDEELARFLGMVADWQRCPKPSDHDAIAALRSEAQGEEDAVRRTWELAVQRAYGCIDYCGGYRGAELEAFHSGIKTVIRALEAGPDTVDTQTAALDRIGAAIHSETPGVTRCRICCERPAALTLCTECADEALWRSIYDQWLAEEATNARFRAIVHEWRCGMCGHWSPRRCRARCQRCGAVRGYGYRDREAVEERTVITYPTTKSESDE